MKKPLMFALLFLLSAYAIFAGTFDEQYITYNQRKVTYYEEQLVPLEKVDAVISSSRNEVYAYIKDLSFGATVNIDTINLFVIRITDTDYNVVVIYTLIIE